MNHSENDVKEDVVSWGATRGYQETALSDTSPPITIQEIDASYALITECRIFFSMFVRMESVRSLT